MHYYICITFFFSLGMFFDDEPRTCAQVLKQCYMRPLCIAMVDYTNGVFCCFAHSFIVNVAQGKSKRRLCRRRPAILTLFSSKVKHNVLYIS